LAVLAGYLVGAPILDSIDDRSEQHGVDLGDWDCADVRENVLSHLVSHVMGLARAPLPRLDVDPVAGDILEERARSRSCGEFPFPSLESGIQTLIE
jgi:hypothetical protein